MAGGNYAGAGEEKPADSSREHGGSSLAKHDAEGQVEAHEGLQTGLKSRHAQMIALGKKHQYACHRRSHHSLLTHKQAALSEQVSLLARARSSTREDRAFC